MVHLVVYSESGGTFKTTTTGNLATALVRGGLDTLVIDLDPQEGNLTSLFGLGEDRDNEDADNIVRHILEMPEGEFDDLIETSDEGVDVVPSHDMLSDFTSNLEQKISYEIGMKDMTRKEYPRYELLYKLLWETEELHKEYDAILIDPNARAEDLVFNAIYALRTLAAPVKPSGKGSLSLEGLEEMVENMEDELGIGIGLSCVIPCGIGNSNSHEAYTQQFVEKDEYPTPITIADRESMMDDMWEANGSAFKVIEERWKTEKQDDRKVAHAGERRIRDREVETLRKIYSLAGFIATETFDEEFDPELVLDIDDYGKETYEVRDQLTIGGELQ